MGEQVSKKSILHPIHVGSEYPWPTWPNIHIVRYYGEHGDGHGTNGAYFPSGGQLLGYKWGSCVKRGGAEGHEVLCDLAVSRDGKTEFALLGGWLHLRHDDKPSHKNDVVPFPFKIERGACIFIRAQGYPLRPEPKPDGLNVEFQVTLFVECKEYEIR